MSRITYIRGDLFSAPPGSILVHACNAVGSWGAGIAVAFREHYPRAFALYQTHCAAHAADPGALVGTCLLIRESGDVNAVDGSDGEARGHDIACLFTSTAYGRRRDAPAAILRATARALRDLVAQNAEGRALHACKFNSGKFAVPWAETAAVVEEVGVEMTVYDPEMVDE